MATYIKESTLESLIVDWLVNNNNYEQGTNEDYNKDYAIDETRLFRFLAETQPKEMEKLGALTSYVKYTQFLNHLRAEITKRGIIDVLRHGIKAYPASFVMFYMTPSEKNEKAKELFRQNIFSVTRQLMYSKNSACLALDICLCINGLPIITCEVKNSLPQANIQDAVCRYQQDCDPEELLFQFMHCMVHFAVDDSHIKFCTKLEGRESWFLPFDKGYNGGTGNPPNPNGIKTDYLWKDILTKAELANIIENYAQIVEEPDPKTKKTTYKQIFPRYHQLEVVKRLLADVRKNGVGQKYLIQHSAGSGRSYSIAWLAHQLVGLEKDGKNIVDSVIVVTDRINQDIHEPLKQFAQVASTVTYAEYAADLRAAIADGKKIIVTTVHQFPLILENAGANYQSNTFAIIINETYAPQNGRMPVDRSIGGVGGYPADGEENAESSINMLLEEYKPLENTSFFVFAAAQKNTTLEIFGVSYSEGDTIKYRPFHSYSIKQAMQEGFIVGAGAPLNSDSPLATAAGSAPILENDNVPKTPPSSAEAGQNAQGQAADTNPLTSAWNSFDELFGNADWASQENSKRQIAAIPAMVSGDQNYQNAIKNSDKENARIESERALQNVMFQIMADNMELFKQFYDNPVFKKWLSEMVFCETYHAENEPFSDALQEE